MKEISNINSNEYWDERYRNNVTQWDLGAVSPPLKSYIDCLKDKSISILIPGCGSAYEAVYLLEQGFINITLIDISPLLVKQLGKQLAGFSPDHFKLICGDFFNLCGSFDLILEQTFFCALPPAFRTGYVSKMAELLTPAGKLVGVLFNRDFIAGPPFGGDVNEYKALFSEAFEIIKLEECYNSVLPRKGTELFMILQKL